MTTQRLRTVAAKYALDLATAEELVTAADAALTDGVYSCGAPPAWCRPATRQPCLQGRGASWRSRAGFPLAHASGSPLPRFLAFGERRGDPGRLRRGRTGLAPLRLRGRQAPAVRSGPGEFDPENPGDVGLPASVFFRVGGLLSAPPDTASSINSR